MDIRWRQRFKNFRRAFGLLREALEDRTYGELSQLEREGVIRFGFFEKVIVDIKNHYLSALDEEYTFFMEKELEN